MKSFVFKIISWYILHFKFPHRGEKYFSALLNRFKFSSRQFVKKLHNGQLIWLIPQDHIQKHILWYGYYEKTYILLWEKLIKNDSIVFDIGANIGYYTIVAANKAKKGRVYAFEPVSSNFHSLRQNITLNNLQNVITNQNGISNIPGIYEYYVSSTDNSGMSGMQPAENFSGHVEKVQTITIDEYVIEHSISSVDFIKIDIEGNELNSLKGMKNTLTKFKPVLFIEILNEHLVNYHITADDVYEYLNDLGYESYFAQEGKLQKMQQSKEGDVIIFIADLSELSLS